MQGVLRREQLDGLEGAELSRMEKEIERLNLECERLKHRREWAHLRKTDTQVGQGSTSKQAEGSWWKAAVEAGTQTLLVLVAVSTAGAFGLAGGARAAEPADERAATVTTSAREAVGRVASSPMIFTTPMSDTMTIQREFQWEDKLYKYCPERLEPWLRQNLAPMIGMKTEVPKFKLKQGPDHKSLSAPTRRAELFQYLLYRLDVLLERYPATSILMLVLLTFFWVLLGGFIWWLMCSSGLKRTALGKQPSFWNCLWASWSCVAASSTHTKESHVYGRMLALSLSLGGLLSYSILCGTVSAAMRARLEMLQSGRDVRPVIETGHVVVAGKNAHLTSLLRQLDRARLYARLDGRASGKQTVILLCPIDEVKRTMAPKMDLPELNMLVRHGDFSSKETFKRMAVGRAEKVVLLSDHDDPHRADANILSSLLALSAAEEATCLPQVVVEVSKPSSARLMGGITEVQAEPVVDMTNRLLAQCMRQCGLTKIYRKLMRHTGTIINLRNFPEIADLPMGVIRREFDDAVVLGLIREGKVMFSPSNKEVYRSTDELMIIANKHTHRAPPPTLVEMGEKVRSGSGLGEQPKIRIPVPEFGFKEGHVVGDPAYEIVRDVESFMSSKSLIQKGSSSDSVKQKSFQEHNTERIVICGWRVGVAETIFELDMVCPKGCELIILAETPIKERELVLQRKLLSYGKEKMKNLRIVHVEGNPCSRTDVTNVMTLAASKSGKVPKVMNVVVVAEGNVQKIGSSADKRSIFSALMAEDICNEHNITPKSIVAEIINRKLGQQVRKTHKHFGYISTMELMGLYISQVIEHPQMNAIWSELLRFSGNSIYIKDPRLYTRIGRPTTFGELVNAANARGECAIGWRTNGRTHLNPKQSEAIVFKEGDGLIVVSTEQ